MKDVRPKRLLWLCAGALAMSLAGCGPGPASTDVKPVSEAPQGGLDRPSDTSQAPQGAGDGSSAPSGAGR